jgi:lipopolysaccharide/colanic/teichoic acid biosynthesis glycosyltransferase
LFKDTQSRWSQRLWDAGGILFIFLAGSSLCWHTPYFWISGLGRLPVLPDRWCFLALLAGAYGTALILTRRVAATPLCSRIPGVFLGVCSGFLVFSALIFVMRLYYSRSFWLFAFGVSFVWLYIGQRLFFSAAQIRYGFTPGSQIQELKKEWRDNFLEIASPNASELFDVLVISPYQEKRLSPEWTRYITDMMIQGVPMAHPGAVYEFFSGRLPLRYMVEGPGVVIRAPGNYLRFKRLFDWILLLLLGFPALIVMGLAALGALCCSGRPVFFVQERIGRNGAPFRMVKFRSMTESGEVTAIGRFLRKYHIDELPQLWNVLLGEMSFIGPRPETPELTHRYTEEIPFYPYRYSVLPGLTGWAQVHCGYASAVGENRVKLSYDLYYVKHASFLLDLLIVLKTIKTILAG